MNYIIQNLHIYVHVYALMFVRVFRVKLVFIANKTSTMFSILDFPVIINIL